MRYTKKDLQNSVELLNDTHKLIDEKETWVSLDWLNHKAIGIKDANGSFTSIFTSKTYKETCRLVEAFYTATAKLKGKLK